MKLSLVVATNKSTYWDRFCGHLIRNSVDFEVLFVGPQSRPAAWTPPVPVRFLHTDANPALCWELGARLARGTLLGFAPDDVCYTDGVLDAVAAAAARPHGEFDMWTARYFLNDVDQFPGMRLMSKPGLPLLPVGGFTRTASHHKLGGIDRRFHAVLWDTDLYMRFVQAGGQTHLLDGYTCHEVGHASTMFAQNYLRDKDVIDHLWFRDGQPQLVRREAVQSYPYDAVTWTET